MGLNAFQFLLLLHIVLSKAISIGVDSGAGAPNLGGVNTPPKICRKISLNIKNFFRVREEELKCFR